MLVEILFYAFGTILVAAALGVIVSRNPVYSALSLVLCFVTSAAIWLLIEAEFLAVVLVLVYVGAVMVLFLFVVMMLDINLHELRHGFTRFAWLGAIVAGFVIFEMVGVVWARGALGVGEQHDSEGGGAERREGGRHGQTRPVDAGGRICPQGRDHHERHRRQAKHLHPQVPQPFASLHLVRPGRVSDGRGLRVHSTTVRRDPRTVAGPQIEPVPPRLHPWVEPRPPAVRRDAGGRFHRRADDDAGVRRPDLTARIVRPEE